MAGIRLEGNTSGNVAEVTSTNELKTSLSLTPANIGGVRLFSENDPVTNYIKSPETSSDYRLRTGIDTLLFSDQFNYTTQDTWKWAYYSTVLTVSQSGNGFIQFGTVQGTASTHGAYIKSFQMFPILGSAPLALQCSFTQNTAPLATNEMFMVGFGAPVAPGTAPTDGVWFELTSSGLQGVLRNNGTTYTTGIIKQFSDFTVNNSDNFCIVAGIDEVEFWCNDILVADVNVPAGWGSVVMNASQQVFVQKICTGAVSNTNKMYLSDVTVTLMDIATNKPWSHQMVSTGLSSYVKTSGTAITASSNNYTNNVAPAAAALTNTTALVTALGGIANITPSAALNLDGIIFSYQNPVPTANITGRNLYITGVDVQGIVTTAIANAMAYIYSIAYGHTAVSLATADTASFITATTHAPRIVPIGIESFTTLTAGSLGGTGIHVTFPSPIVVRPGEFIALMARNPIAAAATGTISVTCGFNGYYE